MEAFVNGRPLFETLKAEAEPVTYKQHWLPVALLFALIGGFLFVSTRGGHALGDDFTMYINHARNIAEGKPYGATGYIYNPDYPGIGPKTYPPGFPLLLAPVYKIFGLNFEALKLVGIITAWLSVLLFYFYWRKELPTAPLLLLLAVLAFSPVICFLKDNIISDLPFLCWVALTLLLVQRIYEQGRLIVAQPVSAILLGVSIYLAYGTRSIGILLLVALVLYDLWHTRQFPLMLRPLTLEVIGVTACLVVLQTYFVHSDSSYGDQFAITARNVLANLKAYASEFSVFWGGGFPGIARLGLFGCMCALTAWGFLVSLKQRVTYLAIFALIYMPPILLVSLQIQLRYLVPLMPPMLYFIWRGLSDLSNRFSKVDTTRVWLPQAAFAALALTILTSYAVVYRRTNWQPYNEGVSRNETRQVASFIQQTTAPEDVLAFIYPRTLALLTERRFAAWHMPTDENELLRYWESIRARYVVTGPAEVEPEHQAYLQKLLAHQAHRFEALYNNGAYQVYRIR
jgi:4-amino-4-deoxy-L-arabinose transferase-like glycosyltransferase